MFLFSFFLFSLSFLSTPVLADFNTADTSFEVKTLSQGAMRFIVRENGVSVFDHYAARDSAVEVANDVGSLRRTDAGTWWSYQGADLSYLSFLVNPQGDIIFSSRPQQTNYELGKSWGFKTSGTLINKEDAAFAIFSSHASQLHNFGILKCLTGDFHHDYYFNKGIMHFGNTQPHIVREAYDASYLIEGKAQPRYEDHIIDDYGAIIAEAGLTITGLTHRIHLLADIERLELQQASIDVQPQAHLRVEQDIKGQARRIAINPGGVVYAGQVNRGLVLDDWINNGTANFQQPSELYARNSLDNNGRIFAASNFTIGSRNRPQALGSIVSAGDIKAIIDAVLDAATDRDIFGKARFRANKAVVETIQYRDWVKWTKYFNVYPDGRRVFVRETPKVFSHREILGRTLQEVNLGTGEGIPGQFAGNRVKIQNARDLTKDLLRKLGLSSAQKAKVLRILLQGLRDAGLGVSDIQAILDDAEIGKTLMGLATIDSVSRSDITALISQQTDSSRALRHFYTQASRTSMSVLNWVKHNGPEFVGHFCDLVNLLTTRGVEHPLVVGSSVVCNAGRFAKTTYSAFKRADAFFSRRYDEGKRFSSGEPRITLGSGGGSSSSSSSVVASSSTKKAMSDLQKALSKAQRVGDNRFETVLEGGSKIVFRKDFGEHAHPIKQYKDPVNHYNVEIHVPIKGKVKRYDISTNIHIIVDDAGNVINILK